MGGGLRKFGSLSQTRITSVTTPHSIFQRVKVINVLVLPPSKKKKTFLLELINSKINELKA